MEKQIVTTLAATLICTGISAQAPAFPGAEGHGRYVTGGRGGKIIHVTNLNDQGAGSLRAAVSGNSKKTIVFDVAGVIPLESDLTIGANTTILGQTAPSPGITIRYYTVRPKSNSIIRFLRIRRGQEKNINDGADATWQSHETGIIFDHCSFSWSIDEVASYYDNNNFTMQWCTVAESLTNPGHSKGAHGYGGIWGGKLASFHHNMIANVMNRGPRFCGARYGWTGYTDNYDYDTYQWKNGKERGHQERITLINVANDENADKKHQEFYDMTSRYCISGNTTETTQGKVTQNKDWDGVDYETGIHTLNGDLIQLMPITSMETL